eukprot:356138-Chlamydomonas_euryale.AAC.4
MDGSMAADTGQLDSCQPGAPGLLGVAPGRRRPTDCSQSWRAHEFTQAQRLVQELPSACGAMPPATLCGPRMAGTLVGVSVVPYVST